MQDILNMPGLFLGLAALFVIIAGAGMRYAELVIIGLLVMGGPALLSLVKINIPALYTLFPLACSSAVSGLWLIFTAGGLVARGVSTWEVWVLLIGGFISLFAAFLALRAKKY
jgi:hypothetical protein